MPVKLREFNNAMSEIKEPSLLKEIRVSPQLYGKMASHSRRFMGSMFDSATALGQEVLTFSFPRGIEVPIIKDKTVRNYRGNIEGGFNIVYKTVQEWYGADEEKKVAKETVWVDVAGDKYTLDSLTDNHLMNIIHFVVCDGGGFEDMRTDENVGKLVAEAFNRKLHADIRFNGSLVERIMSYTKTVEAEEKKVAKEKELGDMATTRLMDIRINGIAFEEMLGNLKVDEERIELTDSVFGGAPGQHIAGRMEHSIELLPDPSKDVSLIMFGLLMAIAQNDSNGAHMVTISGVDTRKPWITYSAGYFVTEWEVNTANIDSINRSDTRRVKRVQFVGTGELKTIIDKHKEPRMSPLFSESETRLVLNTLQKSLVDTTEGTSNKREAIKGIMKQLRDVLDDSSLETSRKQYL